MPVLIATSKAADANSYATVQTANGVLRNRLYTDAWDSAGTTPDAEDYAVNNGAGYSIGDTSIVVDSGTGTLSGTIKFAGHDTEYTLSAALTAPGTMTISPGLTAAVVDDEAVERLTPSAKEKALIWATRLLDNLLEWYGTRKEDDQALRWPRYGVLDRDGDEYDYDTVPADIEKATAELALELLGRNLFATPELLGQGFSEAQVGSLKVKVDKTQTEQAVPDNILAMVSHLGVPTQASSTVSRTVPLRRS